MRSYRSLMSLSLRRAVRFRKGTGKQPCYAVLRYAMLARCGGHYENAGMMGRDYQRPEEGFICLSRLNVHNLSSYTKSFKSVLKGRLAQN